MDFTRCVENMELRSATDTANTEGTLDSAILVTCDLENVSKEHTALQNICTQIKMW